MSITPTAGNATAYRSGRWVMQAPTSRPPFDPPAIASFSFDVYLLSIRYSAAAMKSSNTFCLLASMPARCHSSPYSPPPRRFTMGIDAALFHQRTLSGVKPGVRLMLIPP